MKEIKLEDVFNDEKRQGVKDLIDAHKQETLEEVAEQFEYTNGVYGFKQGVKWQQERSYSEEEVLEILFELSCNSDTDKEEVKEWFEQFKKK